MLVHEIKHDGYRMVCRRDGDRVRVFTRRGHDRTDRVPSIAEALRALPVASATIDGEAVICDANGITDFDRLRTAGLPGFAGAVPYAFDVIALDGRDLRPIAWEARREAPIGILRGADSGIRLAEHLDGPDGPAMFRHACAMGLEGIVSERRDRPYRSGRRRTGSRSRTRRRPRRRRPQ